MNSTVNAKNSPSSASSWMQEFGPPVILAGLISVLPYTLVYLKNLWQLPHYQFFPLLLIAIFWLARSRWGGRYVGSSLFAWFRKLLFGCGMTSVFLGTLFASPWMGYFGFTLIFSAWLAHHRDVETGRSLIYLGIPIILIWQPPYTSVLTADTVLIQSLQAISARMSSMCLDVLGYEHFQPGTVLQFSGRSFGVAEACSGIQSFFAVLCFAALICVYMRRDLLHAVLLMATSPFWAVLMNTLRITAIPIAYSLFRIDLSHGVLHDILGYCTMGLAIGLLLSTDELILLLRRLLVVASARGWYSVLEPIEPGRTLVSGNFSALTAIAILPLAFFCSIQSYDVYCSWGQEQNVVDFFRDDSPVEIEYSDAPNTLSGWPQLNYDIEIRDRITNDLGERSDIWAYQAPFGQTTISFDQMFPGWHELTRCYRNQGWTPIGRQVLGRETGHEWPIVILELSKDGRYGYVLFCLVNRSGTPMQPPGAYNTWTILQERLLGRLTPAVRGALFGEASYQIQLFAETGAPLAEEHRQACLERFASVREILWAAAKAKL